MTAETIARDKTPCPPPGSGEMPVVEIDVVAPDDASSGYVSSGYVECVVQELRRRLASIRCPEHLAAPSLSVTFGPETDASVAVIPHDCCVKLDELVEGALDGTALFRVFRPRGAE
jgi:hypothetical protein